MNMAISFFVGCVTFVLMMFVKLPIKKINYKLATRVVDNEEEKQILYKKLGLDPAADHKGAIGIVTVSPSETAIIAGDIAIKASGAELGFVDRFSGTVILTGTVSEVEASLSAITDYVQNKLGFTVCEVTKT